MIPRLVHRVWVGPNPIPAQYEAWWQAWQRQLPAYSFVTWTDREVASLSMVAEQMAVADSYAKKADIARMEIMRQHGGVYLDCDFMPLNHYDFAGEEAELVVCHENPNETQKCSNGFFAAIPNHPLMNLGVALLNRLSLNSTEVIGETGPGFFGQLLSHGTYKKLPTISFYPYLFNEPFAFVYSRDLSKTYGIHVWFNSWFPQELRVKKIYSMFYNGDLAETERLLGDLGTDLEIRGVILDAVDRIRAIRKSMVTLSRNAVMAAFANAESSPCFALFKTCHFLFSREPSPVVWQIGAGDGIFDDPLRAVLINHDPVAVLLEPNPHLFRRLAANYARNRKAVLLNAAFGPQDGRVIMHLIDPDRAARNGLPPSVAGASSIFADHRSTLGRLLADAAAGRAVAASLDETDVEMVSLARLYAASAGRLPDILVVDTEGMNTFALASILNAGARPRIICYDTEEISDEETAMLRERLSEGWVITEQGRYTAAYRRDFFQDYCTTLFVEHGEATVYKNLMSVLSREVWPVGQCPFG